MTSTVAAKWGFGSEKRAVVGSSSFAPGPGNYNIESVAFSSKHKFFMGQKLNDRKDKMQVPGAGAYSPNFKYTSQSMPKYSMKARLAT